MYFTIFLWAIGIAKNTSFFIDGLRKTGSGGTLESEWSGGSVKGRLPFPSLHTPVSYQHILSYHTDYVRQWLNHNAWYRVNLSKCNFHSSFFFDGYIYNQTHTSHKAIGIKSVRRIGVNMLWAITILHISLFLFLKIFIFIYTLILFLDHLKNSTSKITIKSCLFHILFSPIIHKCSFRWKQCI